MSADVHALTGAYAARALSDTERAAVERHLDDCAACAREVRELTEVTARLGAAVAASPPPGLWDRVRGEALGTGQLPPVAGRVERRRRYPPLLVAAAVLLVAVLSVTGLNLGLLRRADRTERNADLVAAVLAAPDARRVAAGAGGVGQATVVVSRARGQGVFLASGLPPAPEARTYQLWVVERAGPRSAGLVEVDGGGRVARLLDGAVTGDEQVAMTVERRGGAVRPTSEPVLVLDLQA
jgi:anti-sigma-K factor RskA